MANPFETRFRSRCADCGDDVDAGDDMYAHDEEFICSDCANALDVVCHCGNYKKEEYETCYDCR